MSYAFIQDVPADAELYGEVRSRLGAETPPGLLVHVVQQLEGGLRYIDVWESEATWAEFRDHRVMPVLAEVHAARGVVADPSQVRFEPIDVIDTWVGAALVG